MRFGYLGLGAAAEGLKKGQRAKIYREMGSFNLFLFFLLLLHLL
jgi:hypothetical protein